MSQFIIPITLVIDGFLKVTATTYEEATLYANSTYCEVNIAELQRDSNFSISYEELQFPLSRFEE